MQLEEAEPPEPHCWLEASNERLNAISSIESDKRGLSSITTFVKAQKLLCRQKPFEVRLNSAVCCVVRVPATS
jgi:hypothetical protein